MSRQHPIMYYMNNGDNNMSAKKISTGVYELNGFDIIKGQSYGGGLAIWNIYKSGKKIGWAPQLKYAIEKIGAMA